MNTQQIRDRLRAARQFDPATHVSLLCKGTRIGWLRQPHAQRLLRHPDVFERDVAGVRIAESLKSPMVRTAAVDGIVAELYEEGAVTGWRDERYAVVTAFDGPPLFHIERAAARYLGVTTYAAHANGYCGSGVDCEMWLARRAESKPIDPCMLDNLIGGGMSAGVAPGYTIVREAWEEAGIPAALARNAIAAGKVQLLRDVPEGVQSEVIFVFDLELARDFQPCNQDGEVAEFQRAAIADIIKLLATGSDMALEAALVTLSFMVRNQYLALDRTSAAGVLDFRS